jgi:hypothetical protein
VQKVYIFYILAPYILPYCFARSFAGKISVLEMLALKKATEEKSTVLCSGGPGGRDN